MHKTSTVIKTSPNIRGGGATISSNAPRAIILAAGLSSRFVPLCYEKPKGLLRVRGELLIERQIRQLREAGVEQIAIITGYAAEQFAYLREKFGVTLLHNAEFASKNNYASLLCARDWLPNCFVLSSDNYLSINPFYERSADAWYMGVCADSPSKEWFMQTDRAGYIKSAQIGGSSGHFMMGPVFFSAEFARRFVPILERADADAACSQLLWEEIFLRHTNVLKMKILPVRPQDVSEFDSLKELREFDSEYQNNSGCAWLQTAAKALGVAEGELDDFEPASGGMSNRSFTFTARGERYIFRIACAQSGADRAGELEAYSAVKALNISDELVYFDAANGDKICKFIPGARVLNARNANDLRQFIALAKRLHDSRLQVRRRWDFAEQISRYLKLAGAKNAPEYPQIAAQIAALKPLLERAKAAAPANCLCHMDMVSDNILEAAERYYVIDYEYAAMCDPLADLAMFAIYEGFCERELAGLLRMYFGREAAATECARAFSYAAAGALIWQLWAINYCAAGRDYAAYARAQSELAQHYLAAAQKAWQRA